MSISAVLLIAGLLTSAGGIVSFWWQRRRRNRHDAATEAVVEAIVVKKQLDHSREELLKGSDISARSVARLEVELAARKRDLEAMRKDLAKSDASVQELLNELGL